MSLMESEARGTQPKSVQEMLREITGELNRFQAKNLAALQADLTAFVGTEAAIITDYRTKYPSLRDRWCAQHQQIVQLHSALQCAFPNQEWREFISECICKKKHALHCLDWLIRCRLRCSKGKRERARDQAQERFNFVQAQLNALTGNAAQIDAALTADAQLITDIKGALSTPDQPIVLLKFWFQLMPSHRALMPTDVSEDCLRFGEGETEAEFCRAIYSQPCKEEDCACKPPTEDEPPPKYPSRRAPPWLVRPGEFERELNFAWDDYIAAKEDLSIKAAHFQSDPDDIATLQATLTAQQAGLDAAMQACLTARSPDDTCCKPDSRKPS